MATLLHAAPASAREVCTQSTLANTLTIHQTNGYQVGLVAQQQGNELRGSATNFIVVQRSTMRGNAPAVNKSTFSGKARGHDVEVSVY